MSVAFARLLLPFQSFSRQRAFRGIKGGKIYIGKPYKDPVERENRADVWYWSTADNQWSFTGEWGFLLNDGGFPVFPGYSATEPALLSVREPYSLAIYDAHGVQQFYHAKWTPATLQAAKDEEDRVLDILSQDVMGINDLLTMDCEGGNNSYNPNGIPDDMGGLWVTPPFLSVDTPLGFPDEHASPAVYLCLNGGIFNVQLCFSHVQFFPVNDDKLWFRTAALRDDPVNNTFTDWKAIV